MSDNNRAAIFFTALIMAEIIWMFYIGRTAVYFVRSFL